MKDKLTFSEVARAANCSHTTVMREVRHLLENLDVDNQVRVFSEKSDIVQLK